MEFSDEEDSDYTNYSDSDSEMTLFYRGYSERPDKRVLRNYLSLPMLRSQYTSEMEMDKKILLFFNAVQEHDFQFMERLLFDDVYVDCVGKDGWTPLMKACLNGQKQVVQFLLNQGSNPNFQADLYTPLMASCTYNTASETSKLICVNLLLEHNIDINLRDKHKTSALMHAASAGYATIIDRLFMEEDLISDALDFDGWNAIFHAVANNQVHCVQALINYGLDYKLKDNFGRTPMTLAEEKCVTKVIAFFEELEENESVYSGEEEPKGKERESNPYLHYLKELPDADGEGGFPSETEAILSQCGYNDVKNVPFSDFLNMTDDDLLEVGVKINAQRRYILLKVIHRYHRCPWNRDSLNPLMEGVAMGLEEAICILADVAKHLTIVKASLRYFVTRINNRTRKVDTSLQKDTIEALVFLFASSRIMQEKLYNVLELGDDVKSYDLEDLIGPKSVEEPNKVRTVFKYGLMILGATTAGYLIKNSRLKIGSFFKGFMFIKKCNFNPMKWF